jgi:hypothetical protein
MLLSPLIPTGIGAGRAARGGGRACRPGSQARLSGSSTNTGISREVFSWYPAYGGKAATARFHHSARSSPVTSRATNSPLAGPSCSSTWG